MCSSVAPWAAACLVMWFSCLAPGSGGAGSRAHPRVRQTIFTWTSEAAKRPVRIAGRRVRLPELVDLARVELDPGAGERVRTVPGPWREEPRHRHLVELVAREGRLRRAPDQHGARKQLPAAAFVEPLERAIAGEDADVDAARLHRLPRCDHEVEAVALAALGLPGHHGAQAAGREATARVGDLLGKDRQRREEDLSLEQQHQAWTQGWIVGGPALRVTNGRPGLALEREHVRAQPRRDLSLGERDDPHGQPRL